MDSSQAKSIKRGIRIELVSIFWMVVEMGVSIAAGIAAGSFLLTAFGLDSLIELVSGGFLLWRLQVESRGMNLEKVEAAEHKAVRAVAVTLALLCIYVLAASVYSLLTQAKPEVSPLGVGVSAAALLIMPWLAFGKRRISKRIHSQALAGDAVNSITCAYMAGTVFIGLALNAILGWWWVEAVAALVFLVWLGRETWEAFEEARRPVML
jgi:divalent metal cation (Fe/Co/Zn/Cd) transporter